MEHWFSAEIKRRRQELYDQADRARMIRMLESGRSRPSILTAVTRVCEALTLRQAGHEAN